VAQVVAHLAPPPLAEEWDNVGLQIGQPEEPAGKILVALEVTREVIREAVKRGATTLLVHHPLIFRPLKNIVGGSATTDLVLSLVREGLSLVVAHTNLDSVAWGTNGELADRLKMQAAERRFLRPAKPAPGHLLKYAVFTPESHVQAVLDAMASAGGGHIGKYSHCSFRTQGIGTFKPLEGADPFLGEVGKVEETAEWRLECVVPRERLSALLLAVRNVHPYEEIAFDVLPMEVPSSADAGLGLVGIVPPQTLQSFARSTKKALGISSIGVVGDEATSIRTVAVCTGAGGDIIRNWKPGTADVLVTGEMTHHDCAEAAHRGIAVLLVGHYASEVIVGQRFADAVSGELSERGFGAVEVLVSGDERNPLRRM
jgi:dinuclear metal center YbgI/SA1388 family protein